MLWFSNAKVYFCIPRKSNRLHPKFLWLGQKTIVNAKMLDNFKFNFLQKGSVKTFNSSDKVSRIDSSNMDIWWFQGRIFFLMPYFVGDCVNNLSLVKIRMLFNSPVFLPHFHCWHVYRLSFFFRQFFPPINISVTLDQNFPSVTI